MPQSSFVERGEAFLVLADLQWGLWVGGVAEDGKGEGGEDIFFINKIIYATHLS